jgi:serine/threonine-protein kinase
MTDPNDDDATFQKLHRYLEDLQRGRAPDRRQFLAEHPELASWLDCLEVLDQMAPADSAATIADGGGSAALAEASTEFGKYRLLGEIGRGGMGVVYKAWQPELDRIVAIKMILSSHLASAVQVERFAAEARTMARLQHPHIVKIHETGQLHGQHYFVMEHIAGPGLDEVIQDKKRLPVEQAARWVAAVARAVDHLHGQGIVHRDLKPSNILLDDQDRPYVTDFGLVKMLGSSQLTATGAIIGTPSYMSPEQAAGHADRVGPLSDVYSLGAILYELLTGRPPHQEATPLDTLVQVIEGEPAPPRRLNPDIPAKLEMICQKCLEKSAEDRYPSAKALADDLQRFLDGEDIDARPATVMHAIRRWVRREPALVVRLFVLLVIMLIVQINYTVSGMVDRMIHLEILGLLGLWVAASFLFQKLLHFESLADLARMGWSGADISLLTAILVLAQGPITPLLVAYPFLIIGAGLWFQVRLVWFTTILCVISYGLLAFAFADEALRAYPPHYHAIFLVALGSIGYVVAYQVERIRALNRYYEHRQLP